MPGSPLHPGITVADLTDATVTGNGVFDILMKSARAHLEAEFKKGHIKGTEYATVYLGSMQEVLRTSMEFLLQKSKVGWESQILEQALLKAKVDLEKVNLEREMLEASMPKIAAEVALLQQQVQTAIQQRLLVVAQICNTEAQTAATLASIEKNTAEINLLNKKADTESAQTQNNGVAPDSVIGQQKALYAAQRDGFDRNAEHQAAQLMVSSWQVRRTTDEDTTVDNNMLNDVAISRAVSKMLNGVGA